MDYDMMVFGMFGGRKKYEESIERLVEFARIDPDERVLEVCCGTGISTGIVLKHAKQLTAVELNQERMERARLALPGSVRLLTTDALHLQPKRKGVYDLVLCINGFSDFDDPQGFYDMADRMLAPNGRLVFNVKLRDYNGVRPMHNALGATTYQMGVDTIKLKMKLRGDNTTQVYGHDRGFIETDYTPENFQVGQSFQTRRQEVFPLFLEHPYDVVEYWAEFFCELTGTRKEYLSAGDTYEHPDYADFKKHFYKQVWSIPVEQRLLKAELFVEAKRTK